MTGVPCSHAVSRSASASSAARTSAPTSSSRTRSTAPSFVDQPPTIRPSTQIGRAPVAGGVEHLRAVRTEVPVALEPAHRGRVERGQQGDPGLDGADGVGVVGQHPARPAAVQRHLDRADVPQRLPDRGQGRAEPPLEVERRSPGRTGAATARPAARGRRPRASTGSAPPASRPPTPRWVATTSTSRGSRRARSSRQPAGTSSRATPRGRTPPTTSRGRTRSSPPARARARGAAPR